MLVVRRDREHAKAVIMTEPMTPQEPPRSEFQKAKAWKFWETLVLRQTRLTISG